MDDAIPLTTEDLRSIPLFGRLDDEELKLFAALAARVDCRPGQALFQEGDPATCFYLLAAGEMSLLTDDRETHRLRAPAVIGELGALTGLKRHCRAEPGTDAELWSVGATPLRELCAEHPGIGLRLQHALLRSTADKIERDQLRLADMRANIITTQKAMKRLRELLLESVDTPISDELHDVLDGLIRRNRRVNYRVEPPPTLASHVRLDDGSKLPVVQISRTHLSATKAEGDLPQAGDSLGGVLCLGGPEIPLSGRVLRTLGRRVDLVLDLLIDEYSAVLEGYLTRVQMLDYLV